MSSIITHNINQKTYAKLGEIVLRWAEADGFLGNSINWVSGFAPESAEAKNVYKLRMEEKIKSLKKRCRTRNDVATLLQDIQQVMKRRRAERHAIAHGTALKTEDGAIVLRSDKGYEFRIDDVNDALAQARYISDLAIRLNLNLAAPWTKNLFPTLERPD